MITHCSNSERKVIDRTQVNSKSNHLISKHLVLPLILLFMTSTPLQATDIPVQPPNLTYNTYLPTLAVPTTGHMSAARMMHTATSLSNGTALIVGGFGPTFQRLNTLEIYNPITERFSILEHSEFGSETAYRMACKRANHTATLISNPGATYDGQVLIYGGGDTSHSDSAHDCINTPAEIFTLPATITGAPSLTPIVSATVTPAVDTIMHTATFISTPTNQYGNNTVLIAGGRNTLGLAIAQSYLFHADSQTFSSVSPMNTPRYGHTATLLPDGTVLVTGGTADGINILNSTEIYNPATQTWSQGPSMVCARAYHTATAVADLLPGDPNSVAKDRIVVVAGGLTNSGGNALCLSNAQNVLRAIEVYDYDVPPGSPNPIPTFNVLNPPPGVSGTLITLLQNLMTPREHHTATVVTVPYWQENSGYINRGPFQAILFSGGDTGQDALSTSEVRWIDFNWWNFAGPVSQTGSYTTLSSSRTDAVAVALNSSSILLTGGSSQIPSTSSSGTPIPVSGTPQSSAEIFNLYQPHMLWDVNLQTGSDSSDFLAPVTEYALNPFPTTIHTSLPYNVSSVVITPFILNNTGDTISMKVNSTSIPVTNSNIQSQFNIFGIGYISTLGSSYHVNLRPGMNVITITVTPPSGTPADIPRSVYTLNIDRVIPSRDSSLSGLSIANTPTGTPSPINGFSRTTLNYSYRVRSRTPAGSIYIVPVANSARATIKMTYLGITSTVTSGSVYTVALPDLFHIGFVKIVVTAEDGSSTAYFLSANVDKPK